MNVPAPGICSAWPVHPAVRAARPVHAPTVHAAAVHASTVHAAPAAMTASAAVAMTAAAPDLRQKVVVQVGGGVRPAENLDRFGLRRGESATTTSARLMKPSFLMAFPPLAAIRTPPQFVVSATPADGPRVAASGDGRESRLIAVRSASAARPACPVIHPPRRRVTDTAAVAKRI